MNDAVYLPPLAIAIHLEVFIYQRTLPTEDDRWLPGLASNHVPISLLLTILGFQSDII